MPSRRAEPSARSAFAAMEGDGTGRPPSPTPVAASDTQPE